jgi:hypothetical protein
MTLRSFLFAGLTTTFALTACRGQQPAAPPPSTSAAAAASVVETGLAAYLPPAGSLAGWARSKPPQAYSADTLWEFIDGAAETYVGFGFQDALSVGYTNGEAEVGIEIYQMADSLHAFGIYAQERSPTPQVVTAGAEGYANSNVLNFWKGPCYVKMIASRPDRPGLAAMTALARAIGDRMPGGAPLPRALTGFPPKNLVAHSIKFVPKDILGQRDLTNGFEASYQDGQAISRLIVIPFATPEDATAALKRYRAFVSAGGKVRAAVQKAGDEAFSGDDRFSGRVCAVRSGPVVAICVGALSDGAASSLITEYLRARQQDKS